MSGEKKKDPLIAEKEVSAEQQLRIFSNSSVGELQEAVNNSFTKHFGRTPLSERLQDIKSETEDLLRFRDVSGLREEAGDLMASLLQLMTESGWDASELVSATLRKIEQRSAQYAALGRKLRVAILGGAFDPPTLTGHVALARHVLGSSRYFDEVWLMPCFKHMSGKNPVSPEHRLEMCRLAVSSDPCVKVSSFEIDRKLSGETYHTVKHLLEDKDFKERYSFSFVIGSDNANSFHAWVNSTELERMMRFVVVPRAGAPLDPSVDWYRKAPHMILPPRQDDEEISSTKVRFLMKERSANMESLKKHLHPLVIKYILENGLY